MLNEAFDLDKMTHKPISVSPDTPLIDILEVLSDGKVSGLPVVEAVRSRDHHNKILSGLSLGPHPLNGKIERGKPRFSRGLFNIA